jgi:double-strand break repair protein MRE11
MDDETIRIIVATDNHLGFCERGYIINSYYYIITTIPHYFRVRILSHTDPIRCDDSFAAFEEILQTAKSKQADFILLAGDLFHENKPSRRTLHSTIELLRLYCLGSDPVYIEILNDQSEIFKNTFGRANYEDPYQSVSLPIFSIHGNHDDPSREGCNYILILDLNMFLYVWMLTINTSVVGGLGNSLAALDLLSASNLINYFGKADSVEDIEVTPILIRKGSTNIAIYGLGAMRDERLNRMWNLKKVRFVRLTAEQGRDDFFNIFLLHQNRDLGRGTKNCIHESMIPEWMGMYFVSILVLKS